MSMLTTEDVEDQQRRAWEAHFTYHLDILPPLMEALVWLVLPSVPVSRGGSQFDRPQITGGGYFDVVPVTDGRTSMTDAIGVWERVAEYVTRITVRLNLPVRAPWAPILPPLWGPWLSRVNPDPLLARRHALMITGWLADHTDQIITFHELQESEDALFFELRALRARYGVSPRPRRPREICGVCGTRAVTVQWVPAKDGSPKPVRAAVCSNCGDTHLAPAEDAHRPHRAARVILTEACETGHHDKCTSMHCECSCRHRSAA